MDMNDSAKAVCQTIDEAFEGIAWTAAQNFVPHPSQAGITFEDLEEPYVIARFGGKLREQVEVELDSSFIEELIYLSNHAILYYLPCFLKKWLTMRDDFSFNIGMIQLLNNEGIKPGADIWPEFSPAQREAICETLAFVLQHKSQSSNSILATNGEPVTRLSLVCIAESQGFDCFDRLNRAPVPSFSPLKVNEIA